MAVSVLTNIDVDDLGRAAEFYCSALDLTIGRRLGDSANELVGASCPIYLLEHAAGTLATPASSQRRDFARHWTPVHLDFVVPSIEPAVRRAQNAGARLE